MICRSAEDEDILHSQPLKKWVKPGTNVQRDGALTPAGPAGPEHSPPQLGSAAHSVLQVPALPALDDA